jgi:hypothetical protein
MPFYRSLILLAVILSSFAAAQQTSLLAALSERGLLLFSEETPEPEFIPGYDYTKEHMLELDNNGTPVILYVWLAQKEGQDFAPYISVGYRGALDEPSAGAFGYLYGFTATACMGFEEAQVTEINDFVFSFLSGVSEFWLSDTKQFGEVNLTIGGQIVEEELSVIIDYEHLGTPGTDSWEVACGLE